MSEGSPYAPHTPETTAEMLEAVGVETEADLFDIPEAVRFDDEFGIEARSERETRRHVERILERNDDVTEFLGRGHYDHYVPSVVDDLAGRSGFSPHTRSTSPKSPRDSCRPCSSSSRCSWN